MMQSNKVCRLNWPLPVNSSQVKQTPPPLLMYLHCHNTEPQEAQRTINEGIHPEGYYDAVTADHHASLTA